MKRLLSIALVIALCFGLGPVFKLELKPKAAEEETFTYQDYEYKVVDGSVWITKYNGSSGSVTIPGAINGLKVIKIGRRAFAENTTIRTVSIPSSVEEIGVAAFANCNNYHNGPTPDYMNSDEAYYNTIGLNKVVFDKESNLKIINEGAFANCYYLESITLPESVKVIGEQAFYECIRLNSISLPKKIEELNYCCFGETSISSISLPKTVKVADTMFAYYLKSLDNNPDYLPNYYKYVQLPSSRTITFEEGVEFLPRGVFRRSQYVDIKIPDTIKTIGQSAFENAKSLNSITIPKSLERIEQDAFWGSGIESVIFEADSKLKTIDYQVFADCINLKRITIPKSVELINHNAFANTRLESVVFESDSSLKTIESYAFSSCPYLKEITIPRSVEYIAPNAFIQDRNTDVISIETIYGYPGTVAEEYSNEHNIVFIPVGSSDDTSKNWYWNKDNYSFVNAYKYFSDNYYLSPEYHRNLVLRLSLIERFIVGVSYGKLDESVANSYTNPFCIPVLSSRYKNFLLNNTRDFEGSCYGMSLTAALLKKGLLNINDFGVNSTFELSNEDAESVINYYNMSQKVCQRHFIHNDFKAMYYAGKTLMDAEKDIEPFVISTNCHSILCYGAEDGTWEIDDNVFHKRLTIYDPNEPMETHIYIYDDFSNAIYDADRSYDSFSFCPSLIPLFNFGLNAYDTSYRIIHSLGNNISIEGIKGKATIIGNSVKSVSGDLALQINYLTNQLSDGKPTPEEYYYSFEDSSMNYIIKPLDENGNSLKNPKTISAYIASDDSLIGIYGAASSTEVSLEGNVSLINANGDIFLATTSNNNQFDYVTISGQARGDVTVSTDNKELLISGDISDYSITNLNEKAETETLVVPGEANAKVTINNDHLIAMADMDNNGTYETKIDSAESNSNGLVQGPDGKWAMYKEGKVDTTATGIFQNKFGWWRVEKGYVNFDAQGIYQNKYGWWKTTNGKVTFKENGIFQNGYGWWRVKDSKVDFEAQGIYQNQYGWWKTTDGKVTFKENGVFQNENGWWKVKDSKVDFNFTGIASNKYGSWYIKNGKVDFNKKGKMKYNNKTYTVKNGKIV